MSGTYDSSIRRSTRRFTVARCVVLELFALELADRLLEQLHVHLEADGIDVPALLAAEQVAGAANLEVERGDAEPAAQIAELLDRGQPLLRDRRQVVFRRNQQVRVRRADPIGRRGRAADTAATGRSDRRG